MWRRESVGPGSVAIGETVGTSATVETSTQWNRHHHHQQLPRRFDSTELADSTIRNDSLKLVRELNRAVAGHVALATLLGGSGDGPHLRDELRRARRTAQEAAALAKSTLLPSLLDQQKSNEKERTELERLWYLLLCCLDALEMSMHRCLNLLKEFSLADGNNLVIHTGIDGPSNVVTRHEKTVPIIQEKEKEKGSVDLQFRDRLEGVEASQLCKELFELRAQLSELKTTVELRSLLVPEFDEVGSGFKGAPRRADTLISINGTDGMGTASGGMGTPSCSIPSEDKESLESEGSQNSGITNAQRKCICWILVSMVTLFFLALILGVFIALFS